MKNFEKRVELDLSKIQGFDYLLGIDEVGWGPVAGHLCLGFCLVPKDFLEILVKLAETDKIFKKVKDSKKVSEKNRAEIRAYFKAGVQPVRAWAKFGMVETINSKGLAQAYEEALDKGLVEIPEKTKIIIDGTRKPWREIENMELIKKGDDLSWTIALASIFAKEKRDEYIKNIHQEYSQYGWDRNKGYATKDHIDAIKKHGLTDHHRKEACKNFK